MNVSRSCISGHFDVVCTQSKQNLHKVFSSIALVDATSDADWSDAATIHSKMVSSCYSMSAPLLTQLIRLSELEVESTFMILQTLKLRVFVNSGPGYLESGVALPDCRLGNEKV